MPSGLPEGAPAGGGDRCRGTGIPLGARDEAGDAGGPGAAAIE